MNDINKQVKAAYKRQNDYLKISKLYDLIWIKADKLIRKYNPCDIQHMYGLSVVCNNDYMVKSRGSKLCCGGCKWLSHDGCTVKSVGCKVGTCWVDESWRVVTKRDLCNKDIPITFIRQMDRLCKIAKRYRIYGARKSKEETLKNWRTYR